MKVSILGSGAYGLALRHILVNNKVNVCSWTYNEEECKELIKVKKSPKLKNYILNGKVNITSNMEECVNGSDLVIIVVPAFAFEETIKNLKKYINKNSMVLIATKGIEQNKCLFLDEIFRLYLKNKFGIISGPTFAEDIVKDSSIGFSLATKYKEVDKIVRSCFENKTTKFRTTKDVRGIEICGSIKNVMAIASGILSGMKATDSTRALFLTESMNDIKELIKYLGGKKKSILSFAGFGDILMTCTSTKSRNYSFGYLIGSGASQKEIDGYLKNTTVEGMYTLKSIHKVVRKKKVKMPIINLIHDIIIGKKEKEEILKFLIEK